MTAGGTIARCPPDLEDAPAADQLEWRSKQGVPNPFYEVRARGDDGVVPWDGASMGEVEVRGPMVASAYYKGPPDDDRFTPDGWFRTGDIGTIDPRGCVQLHDRAKDLIKSGGEWISSVALENALMGHSSVAEAAVVAVPDSRWTERPFAVVVLRAGQTVTPEALRAHLGKSFPRWYLPDAFEFVSEIPRTSTGKVLKSALRQRYADRRASPPSAAGPASNA